jgi:hypothetical protein
MKVSDEDLERAASAVLAEHRSYSDADIAPLDLARAAFESLALAQPAPEPKKEEDTNPSVSLPSGNDGKPSE